jgi:hypothetical protein
MLDDWLQGVKDAIEVDRKHPSPILIGSLHKGSSSTSADTGIRKAAVDSAKRF